MNILFLIIFCKEPLKHQQSLNTNETALNRQSTLDKILDKLEYPFLTIQQYPVGFVKSLCGVVCARSVKLLNSMSSEDESNTRDKWWIEIRNEIRSHMKSLNCQVVLGYSETNSICEDVCVLSAMGTAALVDEKFFIDTKLMPSYEYSMDYATHLVNPSMSTNCHICHIPYSDADLPFPVTLSQCKTCGSFNVPDVIFSTVQPLPELETIGEGCFLRAIVTRNCKKATSEMSAKMISDYLPFMEYELHRQLLGKLKLKAMNMLYDLRISISIGESLLIGCAEATACYAAALPSPLMPKVTSERADKTPKEIKELDDLNDLLETQINRNKEFYHLNNSSDDKIDSNFKNEFKIASISNESSDKEVSNVYTIDSKACFKIEIDDVHKDRSSVFSLLGKQTVDFNLN
jgi:hypothetical protein